MTYQLVVHWLCGACDVEGRDIEPEPSCWNCGGPVTITARPAVPVEPTGCGLPAE